jgi:glucose-6-phosphate 1-epimerase
MKFETLKFQAAGSQVVISLYGGQLLSWQAADGIERLYTPDSLQIEPGFALRGGVPICFPQFSSRGNLIKHGFARILPWSVIKQDQVTIVLGLSDSDHTRSMWNYAFSLEQHISLNEATLTIKLHIRNMDSTDFYFTNALHTYLYVENVLQAELCGLKNVQYEDALQENALKIEQSNTLQVFDELDRVYQSSPSTLQLKQPAQKTLQIQQEGFTDTVIWNPGILKAEALNDMPTLDWQKMLCVEAAVASEPQILRAGHQWSGLQRLSIVE